MAERVYKWNTDALESCIGRLNTEKDNLNQNKSVIENLKSEIMEHWQSFSSEIYLDNLETDIEDLSYVIQAVEELSRLLQEVVTDAYQECEDYLDQRVRQIASLAGFR